MPRLVGVRQIWTFLGAYLLSVVALGAGPLSGLRMLETPSPSLGLRVSAVLLGVGGLVPVIAMITWLYRRSDEYERHLMLLQLAVAFAVHALLATLIGFLHAAAFLDDEPFFLRWCLAIVAWAIALVGTRLAGRTARETRS